jgi:hypothetical protein
VKLPDDLCLDHVKLREQWEAICTSRSPDDVSSYEAVPLMSRELVVEALEEEAETVIDVGGGASSHVDELLDLGAKRVAVLERQPSASR